MSDRIVGAPDPRRPVPLNQTREFETFRSHVSAEGRAAMAKFHMQGRNLRMFELLCAMSSMAGMAKSDDAAAPSRLRALGTGAPTVTCGAALWQKFDCAKPLQAAHYLPGQIRLNGLTPPDYLHKGPGRLYVMDLFSDAEKLHENFNKADSAVEAGSDGLKSAAAECAYVLFREHSKPDGRVDRTLVLNLYERFWIPRTAKATDSALKQKAARPHPRPLIYDAQGNIANLSDRSSGDATSRENVRETELILEEYAKHVAYEPSPVQIAETFQRIEAVMRE